MSIGELGGFGGDEDIAGKGELEAAGDGKPVDGGDDRDGHRLDDGDEGVAALLVDAALAGAELAQVEAGAEGAAGAGDNHNVDVGRGAQLAHRGAEGGAQLVIEGVQLVGPIEGYGGDTIAAVEQDYRRVGHARTPVGMGKR